MIALKHKNAVEDRNILYLECECGCDILVLEYSPASKDVTILSHSIYTNHMNTNNDFLIFKGDDAVELLRTIITTTKDQLKKTIFPVALDDGDRSIAFMIDNYIRYYDRFAKSEVVRPDDSMSLTCFDNVNAAEQNITNLTDVSKPLEPTDDTSALWGITISAEQNKVLVAWARGVLTELVAGDIS